MSVKELHTLEIALKNIELTLYFKLMTDRFHIPEKSSMRTKLSSNLVKDEMCLK